MTTVESVTENRVTKYSSQPFNRIRYDPGSRYAGSLIWLRGISTAFVHPVAMTIIKINAIEQRSV